MSRYTLFPELTTSAELITHVRALLAILRPEDLRSTEVHEALAQVADALGQNLSAEEVRAVVDMQPAQKLKARPRRKRP